VLVVSTLDTRASGGIESAVEAPKLERAVLAVLEYRSKDL